MNVSNFVSLLREQNLLYLFSGFAQDNLIDLIPDDDQIGEIDEDLTNAEFERLIGYFINDPSDAAIDDKGVSEVVEINQLYDRALSIFHCELVEFGSDVEFYDEFSNAFVPLIFDRFGRLMLS